jgi:hypothetical protein
MVFNSTFNNISAISCYWWEKPEYPEKTSDQPQVTNRLVYRYIMFGRGICKKYQSKDEKFPERNLVSGLIFFADTLPNMIYLFNYTEYYLEHWINK